MIKESEREKKKKQMFFEKNKNKKTLSMLYFIQNEFVDYLVSVEKYINVGNVEKKCFMPIFSYRNDDKKASMKSHIYIYRAFHVLYSLAIETKYREREKKVREYDIILVFIRR